MSSEIPLIHKPAPHFGFDIGSRTIKIVQLRRSGRRVLVQGYGYCYFPRESVVEGIIVDPEVMAKVTLPLLRKMTFGSITANRIVTGLPAGKIFTRTLQLPPMTHADLVQAVQYEVEQYVPVPVNDLYIDYEIITNPSEKHPEHIDVLMVAAPKAIVDSYTKLFECLGLQIEAIEPSTVAVVRAIQHSGAALDASLIIDIGSDSCDFTIFDKVIPLTGSVAVGGDHYTEALVKNLGIKPEQANEIKVKFGIGPSGMQTKVMAALEPQLKEIVKEAKRVLKFYQDRSQEKQAVKSLVLTGGTASMPGLTTYLEQQIGLPLTTANPWRSLETKKMQPVSRLDAPMYTTAIGLAMRPME